MKNGGITTMHKRINITLPEETVTLIDEVAHDGNRSSFIDTAVKHYIETVSKDNLRKRLKEGAIVRAARDRAIASEWFSIDEEAWQAKQR
jgi:CopG family transcriptional regulator / antitoxin EndoAI